MNSSKLCWEDLQHKLLVIDERRALVVEEATGEKWVRSVTRAS